MEQTRREGFRLHLQEDFPIEEGTRETKVTTEKSYPLVQPWEWRNGHSLTNEGLSMQLNSGGDTQRKVSVLQSLGRWPISVS